MIKPGVDVRGIKPEILLAIQEAREVYRNYDAEFTLTSVRDGNHMEGSKHYEGQAVDIRIWDIPPGLRAEAAEAINRALGPQYDVVLERDHLHVEFDPK